MKKRILFDGMATQGTSNVPVHGGGEYAKRILRKAISLGYINFDIVFLKSRILDNDIINLVSENLEIKVYYINKIEDLFILIKTNNYACFFSAMNPMLKSNLDILFITVIHDLRPIELPWDEYKHKYYTNVFKRFLGFVISSSSIIKNHLKNKYIKRFNDITKQNNVRIITVSEHSKYSMLYFIPSLDSKMITVCYPPFDFTKIEIADKMENDYYLLVNANRFEKNAYRAVKVFDNLFSEDRLKSKRVILTGCTDPAVFGKIKNRGKFEFMSYVSHEKLESLFKNAFAFVYPSLNEGFGIVVLSAMKYGVPVIASSASSIPEVCGDAAVYFNPTSMDEFANRILQINCNNDLYQSLVTRGLKRIREFEEYQEKHFVTMIKGIFD